MGDGCCVSVSMGWLLPIYAVACGVMLFGLRCFREGWAYGVEGWLLIPKTGRGKLPVDLRALLGI